MPSPVSLAAAVVPPQWQLEPQGPSFEVVMSRVLRQAGAAIEKQEISLDGIIKAATSGRQFSNAELLALQATMHKYSLEVDLLSKLVQQSVQGLRDLLRTQV